MEMTDDEIRVRYRQAKFPREQIKILADLNQCNPDKIREIVAGVDANTVKIHGNRKPRFPEESINHAVDMVRAGASYAEAAREVKSTAATVMKWCAERGVKSEHHAIKYKLEDDQAPDPAPDPEQNEATGRKEILEAAEQCVCGDRDQQYGSPEDNFAEIAKLWADWLDHPVTAHDVAMMMTLFKLGRIKSGQHKADNYIDAAGLFFKSYDIHKKKKKK